MSNVAFKNFTLFFIQPVFHSTGFGHKRSVCAFKEIECFSGKIAKIICGGTHTFIIKGKICHKCGCCFTPTKLSDEMLMATKIPGICADMIYKIIKLYARMSEKSDCSKGGHCHC